MLTAMAAASFTSSQLAGDAPPLKLQSSPIKAAADALLTAYQPGLQTSQHSQRAAAVMPPPAPPPPPARAAASRRRSWRPFCSLQWYATHSPSVHSGLTPQAITSTHISTFHFLSALCDALRYPCSVLECAMSLYHRFFARRSLADYDVRLTAAACVFLASKVEDAPRRMIELIRQFEVMRQHGDEYVAMSVDGLKEGTDGSQHTSQHASHRSSSQASSLPSPAALSPAVNHALADQQERDKLERLTHRELELRALFTSLESEVLLANDFDFTFPLPSRYIRLLVRQLVTSPPRADSGGAQHEGWEEDIRQAVWRQVVLRGADAIVVNAMLIQQLLLPTTADLHFSPQCIAVLCVLVACRASHTDLERLLQLGGWVAVVLPARETEQQMRDVPAEVKDDVSDAHLSPSSFTASTPSFSPLYAVSPSSPSTASPASLSSIHSSPSQPPPFQPLTNNSAADSTTPPASPLVASPYTAAWLQRVLPGLSADEITSLYSLLCVDTPLVEQLAQSTTDIRELVAGLSTPMPAAVAGGDLLDVLRVRGEYEGAGSELVEARRLREMMAAQKEVEEARRRREEAEQLQKREEESARRLAYIAAEETKSAPQERQTWVPHPAQRGGRPVGRGRGGWQADRAVNQRPAVAPAERDAGSWRGRGGHRGGWAGRQQPLPQPAGWQSTVVDATPAFASRPQTHSNSRALSPVRHRSPEPPPKRKRSPSPSPPRRHASGGRDRERDREWDRDRERDGRVLRESGDRQRGWRDRSPSPASPRDRRGGGSGRAKRPLSPSPVRDRGRGRR